MTVERDPPRLLQGGAPVASPPAMWPGIVVGAALGGVVGAASLLLSTEESSLAPASTAAAASQAQSVATAVSSGSAKASPSVATAPSNAVSAAPTAAPPAASSAAAAAPSGQASPQPLLIEGENEVDYLRRAHLASPAEALLFAEAHPRRYPDSKLGQEREMIAISSLAALGRKDEARARARLFLTLFPDSTHRRQVEVLVPDLAVTSNPRAP